MFKNLRTAAFKERIYVPVSGHKCYVIETKKTKQKLRKNFQI